MDSECLEGLRENVGSMFFIVVFDKTKETLTNLFLKHVERGTTQQS